MAGKESFWFPWVPDKTRGRNPSQGLGIAVDAWSKTGQPGLWVSTVVKLLLKTVYLKVLVDLDPSGPPPTISDSEVED